MKSNQKAVRHRFFIKNFLKVMLILLILFCMGMVYYFAFIRGTHIVFTHFFYVPIALAGFLWGRKSIWVVIFLGACFMVPYALLVSPTIFLIQDILRVVMFIVISLIIGLFRENSLCNERKFIDIVQGNPVPTFVINKDHIITHFNSAYESLTGFSAGEMIGSKNQWMPFYLKARFTLADLIVDDVTEEEIAELYKGILLSSDKGVYEGEIFIPEAGEDGRWLHVTASPIRNSKGKIIGSIETLLDITERKRTEEALFESEERYRRLVEFSPYAIFVHNEGKFVFANSTAAKLLGTLSPEELIGKPIKDIIHPDYRKIVKERIQKIQKERKNAPVIEEKLIRLDDTVIDVEVAGTSFPYKGELANLVVARDITERKRMEERLQKSEEILRATLNSTADAILVVDNNRKVVHVNEQFLHMWDVPEEVLGTMDSYKLLDYVSDQLEDPRAFIHKVEKLYKTPREGFDTILFKDGRIFERYSCPLLKDGEIAGRVWNFRDITERKRMEKELKDSEEKFRELFHNANDVIFLYGFTEDGLPGRFIEVNDVACKRLGYSREEFLNMSIIDIVDKEYFDRISENVGELLEKGNITFEIMHMSKSGHKIPVEVNPHIFDLKGEKVVLSIARDISERKQVENALRESEERYRLLVELLPDAIFVNKDGKLIFANSAAAKLLGASSPEVLTLISLEDYVHSDYREIVKERIRQVLEEGKEVPSLEQKFIRFDGTVVDVEVAGTSFPYKGKLADLAVVRDITERKRAEELRKKAEENKRLLNEVIEYDRLKTEFFSNISHELRTPLNVIFAVTQLLDLYLKDSLIVDNDNKINKRINTMKQNCYRLLRLVNNLIDITKIDAGFFQIQLQNHNIVDLVEEITISVAEYIQSKGITFNFDTDVEEKIMACDPDKIERIILNLLSNAIKFTKPSGSIMVNMHNRGESIIISVKDTGVGIPEDKLEIIFERFRQADKLLTRGHEGSGIGLSLVQSLVEMHGGRISVESEYGKGSEFIIELPVKVLSEKNNISERENCIQESYIERINIEFSDIYSLN